MVALSIPAEFDPDRPSTGAGPYTGFSYPGGTQMTRYGLTSEIANFLGLLVLLQLAGLAGGLMYGDEWLCGLGNFRACLSAVYAAIALSRDAVDLAAARYEQRHCALAQLAHEPVCDAYLERQAPNKAHN